MNVQSELQPKPLPSRSTRAVRKFVAFVCIVAVMVLAVFLLAEYDRRQNIKALDELAQTVRDIQKADYEEALRDTYGGTTPQETLSLYISALEKNDYELASRYFIGTKQKEELESLNKMTEKFKSELLGLLKQSATSDGQYSEDRKDFSIEKPIFVDFKQYPNGIWKIINLK